MPNRVPATDARWLPNYVKAFGLIDGLRLLRLVIALDRADAAEPAEVTVPELGRLWLRGRLRDHAIFQQVWVKREYDLAAAAPRHWPLLREAYEATIAAGRRPLIVDAGGACRTQRALVAPLVSASAYRGGRAVLREPGRPAP